jgi:hypothetical protein
MDCPAALLERLEKDSVFLLHLKEHFHPLFLVVEDFLHVFENGILFDQARPPLSKLRATVCLFEVID